MVEKQETESAKVSEDVLRVSEIFGSPNPVFTFMMLDDDEQHKDVIGAIQDLGHHIILVRHRRYRPGDNIIHPSSF